MHYVLSKANEANMHWLEIIKIRCSGNTEKNRVIDLLKELNLSNLDHKPLEISFYNNKRLENDISLHIRWKLDHKINNESTIGLDLVHELTEFGIVNHTVWIEC